MSASRRDYFVDLLNDSFDAIDSLESMPDSERAQLAAALIISDGLNGLRKALLQTQRAGTLPVIE